MYLVLSLKKWLMQKWMRTWVMRSHLKNQKLQQIEEMALPPRKFKVLLVEDINSQKVVQTRVSDPVVSAIHIKSVAGKVTTNKVDAATEIDTPQGEATLTGAIYDIFDETNPYITSITTGADSNGTSINLPRLGKYYLLERTPSTGYQLDTTKYWFEMTLDNLYPTIKVYADANTGILTPAANIESGFYD